MKLNVRKKKVNQFDMAAVYDAQAQAFAEQAPSLPTWEYIGSRALDRHINYAANPRIYDQGSASGRLEQHFIERGVDPANLVGIEISPKQVDIAKQRIPGANFAQGDAREVAFNEEFDVVVSHMVYEFLDNDGLLQTLNNAYQSLQPGAKLVYVVTHPGKMEIGNGMTEEGWFETTVPWGDVAQNYYRPVEKFIQLTQQAGFSVETVEHLAMPDEDHEAYEKYKDYGPIRLVVVGVKP